MEGLLKMLLDYTNFFSVSGVVWKKLLGLAVTLLTQNPTNGSYKTVWNTVTNLYDSISAIAGLLIAIFFVYGFLRESCDIHAEYSLDTTFKLFIRLIICGNLAGMSMFFIKKFIGLSISLTKAVSGDFSGISGFSDGMDLTKQLENAGFDGYFVLFLFGILFLIFTVFCGVLILFTVLNRIFRLYLIAPFAAVALSTLAAGGNVANTGYSYIKTFLGYTFSAVLIAVALTLAPDYIKIIKLNSDNGFVIFLEYCLRMGAVTSAVKAVDSMMTKVFGL